ncbi:TraB/GumN family protein [Pseudoalteromonas sp. MEBiC 03607]|uniref:TraB/GumN family protein n=1 Tax=Pseudoalteromonas sp. MEBiC 03607 TaxID=2563601 RepID=UPI0010935328|nr:TraB/GumN family protein [Pseudoalteromonas sp. MEBiC 03607]TGV18590.1 TraB/GumN family protein [Pseudoalteromonas sp. MEBiC 03607]
MKTLTRYLLISFIATSGLLASSFSIAKSAIWQVSKGDEYIYLAGSIHILPSKELPLPTEFNQAYKLIDTLVLEADVPAPSDSSAQLTLLKALSYQAGETLSSKLTEKVKQQLKLQLNSYGMHLYELDSFRPFMVSLLIMSLELQKQQLLGEGVDSYLAKLAKQDNKKIAYLETLAFQLNLFKQLGNEDENTFIESLLAQVSDFQQLYVEMLYAWRNGDMQAMAQLTTLPLKQRDPLTYEMLIKQRNLTWLSKIERYFTNHQKELVLVGAAHLAGEDSLLGLLKNKGYAIKQLNTDEE